LCIRLAKSAVPSPLSGHQLLSSNSPVEYEQVIWEFGATVTDPDARWNAIHAAAQTGSEPLSKAAGRADLKPEHGHHRVHPANSIDRERVPPDRVHSGAGDPS
jgi:hypothetical protein